MKIKLEKIENYAIHIQEDMYIVATDETSTSPISISGSSSKNGIEHWTYAVNLIGSSRISVGVIEHFQAVEAGSWR